MPKSRTLSFIFSSNTLENIQSQFEQWTSENADENIVIRSAQVIYDANHKPAMFAYQLFVIYDIY